MHTIKAKIPALIHKSTIELDGKPLEGIVSIQMEAGVHQVTKVTIEMFAEVDLEVETEDENLEIKV